MRRSILMNSLAPRIESGLSITHGKLSEQGKFLSPDRRKASLEAFRARFGPDRLRSLDGPELLQVMHTHGNRDSMVYWIEYKNDDEFAGLHFGGKARSLSQAMGKKSSESVG